MTQLTLELIEYPRPIAWTLSELDRTEPGRDKRDMLLTAFEDVTRYLTLVAMARYAECFAKGETSESVEGVLQGLRRPSFGHYVQAVRALDQYLLERSDPFALDLLRDDVYPAAAKICATAAGAKPKKKVNFITMLSRVVEIRNRDKAHGFTDHDHAKATTDLLAPALVEFLDHARPVLIGNPLVWIDVIEFVDDDHSTVTYLELMGTQRASKRTRGIHKPGNLQKHFMYMWNGESAPVQLTPFFHLERSGHEEIVYLLATLGSEPAYRAPGISASRRPDPLLTQLSQRAPFLMTPDASVTAARAPDAVRRYRDLVDMALADALVTDGEAKRLAAHRADLGLSEAEATEIHEALGWSGAAGKSVATGGVGTSPARDAGIAAPIVDPLLAWPDLGRRLASVVRNAVPGRLGFEPELILLDDDLDVAQGDLWVQLQPSRGIAMWFPRTRKQLRDGRVQIVVGFYSQNQRRDPVYRAARERLETTNAVALRKGWSELDSGGTFIGTSLALETSRAFAVASLGEQATVDEIVDVVVALADAARVALEATSETTAEAEPRPKRTRAIEAEAFVAEDVPAEFDLPELPEDSRVHGSIWIARILWALEWARRHDPAPKSAADISRILSDNGVRVPPTNTARAFRVPRDDPRRTGLCEEPKEQRYVISASGRRALFELLTEA